jgi:putative transposase
VRGGIAGGACPASQAPITASTAMASAPVHAVLVRQGERCCPELVREIMRELGLLACQPRPWRPTTTQPGEGAEAIPDLVQRDFTAATPGTKLVSDIMYLPTWQGFAYLATVIDCCTQRMCWLRDR